MSAPDRPPGTQDASSTSEASTTSEPSSTPDQSAMRTFGHILVNTAVANVMTSYLWWALIFWSYLETRSVLVTGVVGGAYMLLTSFSSIAFGSLVDHHRKLAVMRLSSVLTLVAFGTALGVYLTVPERTLLQLGAPWFWMFSVIVLAGAVVENMRNIALSTTVTILVPDERRANANGLVGTVQGIGFMVTSVLSGLSIGLLGMGWTLVIALTLTAVTFLHLLTIRFPQDRAAAGPTEDGRSAVDLRGSIRVIRSAPGLFGLIFFATFNNLIGGVYMALMDPYGLELFAAAGWGIVLAVASTGFIIGGALVAKFGLGANPLRTMLLAIALMGLLGALFTIREWWLLFAAGTWLYMCLIPIVEATEQTVIQRVVPLERQGRVIGFATALEWASAPITAFLIAPIAQFWILPWARSDEGAYVLRPILGSGDARGIALVFLVAGLIMLAVAVIAFRSTVYRSMSQTYRDAAPSPTEEVPEPEGQAAEPSVDATERDGT
jgi:DHA3 family multidrug efflux protein-like MFS transporter